MNKQEQIKTARMIVKIGSIVNRAKQKTIKKILKRLNKMSPDDIQYLAQLLQI